MIVADEVSAPDCPPISSFPLQSPTHLWKASLLLTSLYEDTVKELSSSVEHSVVPQIPWPGLGLPF